MALSRISKLAGDYAGDLALPLSTIASGGSKILATFQLIGGILVTKVLGPLGAVAGIVYGITSSFVGWARAVDLVGQAMDRAAAKQAMVRQLAEITKSGAVAKAKLQDLLAFAQSAPFSLSNILEGGKALAQVSAGALLTKKNLALVGDTSAATNQQFNETAKALANLYDDLKNGRPVDETAQAMKEMGIFSQSTVDKLVELQRSGANITTTFNVATEALKANAGAMKTVTETIEDLQEKQGQVKAGILTPAGQIFNDSQKKGIEAQTQLLEKLAPVLTVVFRIVARVSDVFGVFQRNILRLIASIPGLSAIVGTIITAFTLLATATAAVSSAKFLAFIAESILALRRYTIAAGGAAAASAAFNAANGGKIGGGISQIRNLATEAKYGVEGGLIGPRISAGMAVGEAAAGAKSIAMGGAANLAAGAMTLLRSAIAYVAEGLAVLATGFGAAVTGLAALAVGATIAYDKFSAATDAINELSDATNKSADAFNKQLANVRTAADAAAVYQNALEAVKEAQDNLATIQGQRKGNGAAGMFGVLDALNQQDTKELAAKNALGQAQQYADRAKKMITSPSNALPEDINSANVAIAIQANASMAQAGLNNPILGAKERVERLKAISDSAEREMREKSVTEQQISQATTPDEAQGFRRISGSREMNLQAELNDIPDDSDHAKERQSKQNQIDIFKAASGDAPSKFAAAQEAISAFNQNLPKFMAEFQETQKNFQAGGLRVEAGVAGASGYGDAARAKNAQAETLEGDAEESRKRRQYLEENLAKGFGRDEATADANKRAGAERTQDLAAKGLANLAAVSGPVVDSLQAVGLGGGIEQTDPLISISQAQLDALHEIQKTLEDSAKKTDNVY